MSLVNGFGEIFVAAFALATVGCAVAARSAWSTLDGDVRRSMTALLALSSVWGAASTLQLFVPAPELKRLLYVSGLVVGLASVLAWLAFCSAYTGREYHRRSTYRAAGIAAWAAVSTLKLTNPVHGWYFSASLVEEPFAHLAIRLGAVHWVVTSAVYGLTAVGFYFIAEMYAADRGSRAVPAALFSLTALPVVPTLLAHLRPGLVPGVNYEPLGVAVFAVGALFFARRRVFGVGRLARRQLVADLPDPVVVTDADGRVVIANDAAVDLFPGLADAPDVSLASAAPALAGASTTDGGRSRDVPDGPVAAVVGDEEGGTETLTVPDGGDRRHYVVDRNPVELGPHEVGTAVVLSEATALVEQRRELKRQNRQLDDFAAALTHELRNPLEITLGYADVAADVLESSAGAPGPTTGGAGEGGNGSEAGNGGEGADAGGAVGADAPAADAPDAAAADHDAVAGDAGLAPESDDGAGSRTDDSGAAVADAAGEGRTADAPVRLSSAEVSRLRTAVDSIRSAAERSSTAVDDLGRLARQGKTVRDTDGYRLGLLAREAYARVGTDSPELVVGADGTVEANRVRLKQLFVELFEHAIDHGADRVTVALDSGGFEAVVDGVAPPSDPERLLAYGESAGVGETETDLAVIRTLARAHGWSVAAYLAEDGNGVRFRFEGVETGGDVRRGEDAATDPSGTAGLGLPGEDGDPDGGAGDSAEGAGDTAEGAGPDPSPGAGTDPPDDADGTPPAGDGGD